MNKYEMTVEVMKMFDELDELRARNDVLERQLREYKVSEGSGALTGSVVKLCEYGRKSLFDKCFRTSWYSIGVDVEDGAPKPSTQLGEWSLDCFRSGSLPDDFSAAEALSMCEPLLAREYEREYAKELDNWMKERDGDGEDE